MHEVVDVRLRQSLELIIDMSAATPEQISRWWDESQLSTNLGVRDAL